ncbi:helicase HerA-like domain-containing protein [Myroides injenensis]|uniref:helicase HerA-like domain-containing protein n=1 Tax=Myroides injenensis TaxID=1183151 RepID=UPI0003008697|nr:helicase HerA-like domain-containing protein [Myroides injenensis]
MNYENFTNTFKNGYMCKGDYITIGSAKYDNKIQANSFINIPLKTINRHGLIAGATGTGKTKTIQVLSEQLSAKGIPVLMMDIKGDFSGIAQKGTLNDFISDRHQQMNLPFNIDNFPVELLSISHQNGVRLRATLTEFGPILFSRILDLNDTQSGIVSLIFKYCDDKKLPLLDLKDFKKTLQYLTNEGKAEIEAEYGRISAASTGAIIRKLIEIEQQGGELFFGEPSFDISDLMRVDDRGYGYVNILRLDDIQDKPKLFSTFMLNLLAQVYSQMPEQGDSGQPELVIFIDEAHLIFNEASKALLNQIETIVKLIRSKGIGIYFITQNPTDIPNGVLAQLGLKIQHALRAFTEKDRKAIKTASENFPSTEFYKTNEIITQLGTGDALVTALNEKGIPTPLVVCAMRAPASRMDILSKPEIDEIIEASTLAKKYNNYFDRESAYEILTAKLEQLNNVSETNQSTKSKTSTPPKEDSNVTKGIIKVVTSATFIRGAFGILNKILSSNNKRKK